MLDGLAGFEAPPEPGRYLDPASAVRSDLIAAVTFAPLVEAANGPLNKTGAYDEPILAAVERLVLAGDVAGTVGLPRRDPRCRLAGGRLLARGSSGRTVPERPWSFGKPRAPT